VGVFGKEGRQAALASDYAIHEFRHLRRLLFVHGRWSAVRAAGVIQFSLYKNIAWTLPLVYFAFFSGFTAQPLFDQWLITFYNAFFTALPPLIFGLLDRDLSAEQCLRYPEAYRHVQRMRIFSFWTFFGWLVEAIWLGSVVFWFLYGLLRGGVLDGNGKAADLATVGLIGAVAVTMAVHLRAVLWYRTWTWLSANLLLTSLSAFWVFLLVYSLIYWPAEGIGMIYHTIYYLFGMAIFWCMELFLIPLGVMPSVLGKFVQSYWFPRSWEVLRERDACGMETSTKSLGNSPAVVPDNAIAMRALA